MMLDITLDGGEMGTSLTKTKNEAYLQRVVAGDHFSIHNLDVRRRMSKFAFGFASIALVSLMLPANFEREPTRVLEVGLERMKLLKLLRLRMLLLLWCVMVL